MPRYTICIKVPKIYGQKTLRLANELQIADHDLKIQRSEDHIFIPLVRQLQEDELDHIGDQIPQFEIASHKFPVRKSQQTLRKLLRNKVPLHVQSRLPRAFDLIGDIALLEISQELDPYKKLVGDAVLRTHKNIRSVFAKTGAVSGTYRLWEIDLIAGKKKTETVHKEYGCKYFVDIAEAFFSPRLSYEHNRVASLVQEGETIVDMFAGVGPFAILIAKTHENVKVYAIDINPRAVELLSKNIRLNGVEDKVCPILGDARKVVGQKISGLADRLVMNLPGTAVDYLNTACEALKPEGGTIHFYSFVSPLTTVDDLKTQLAEEVRKSGREMRSFLLSRYVRSTAPFEHQVVLDAEVC